MTIYSGYNAHRLIADGDCKVYTVKRELLDIGKIMVSDNCGNLIPMYDMERTIIRSNRKTVSIEVKPDLTVTLRVPRHITEKEIDRILKEKQPWINKHLEQMQVRNSEIEARKQPMLCY